MTYDVTAINRERGYETRYTVKAASLIDAVRVASTSHPEARVTRVILHDS